MTIIDFIVWVILVVTTVPSLYIIGMIIYCALTETPFVITLLSLGWLTLFFGAIACLLN